MKASELKAGDWFELNGQRCRVVSVYPNENVKYERIAGFIRHIETEVTPLPDCTGWDWQPHPPQGPVKVREGVKFFRTVGTGKPLGIWVSTPFKNAFIVNDGISKTVAPSVWTHQQLIDPEASFAQAITYEEAMEYVLLYPEGVAFIRDLIAEVPEPSDLVTKSASLPDAEVPEPQADVHETNFVDMAGEHTRSDLEHLRDLAVDWMKMGTNEAKLKAGEKLSTCAFNFSNRLLNAEVPEPEGKEVDLAKEFPHVEWENVPPSPIAAVKPVTQGPSKEWLIAAAEREDECPSVSVGGMASDLGVLNVSEYECAHCGTPDILPSGRCAHCNLPQPTETDKPSPIAAGLENSRCEFDLFDTPCEECGKRGYDRAYAINGGHYCETCATKLLEAVCEPIAAGGEGDIIPLGTVIEEGFEWEDPVSKTWHPVEQRLIGQKYIREETRVRRRRVAPRYRAFASAEEFKPHRDRWIRHESDLPVDGAFKAIMYGENGVSYGASDSDLTYAALFQHYLFDDDASPCGAREAGK